MKRVFGFLLTVLCISLGGTSNINAQEMQGIGIYIPPIEKQREFALFNAQVDKSKAVVQHSLDKLETLKKALMQEYFG